MKTVFVVMALLFASCGAWVRDDATVRAVEKQGYSNVTINAKHIVFPEWCGCAKGDDAAYDMTATNPAGVQVNIIACAGVLKGVTVRTR